MKNGKVVFVDDEDHLRLAAKQALDLADFDVECFPNADRVAGLISRNYTGVLVTDIRMPGMDGMELMQRVLEIDPELPVVLVTGHGDVQLAVEAMRLGAYDFIEKPFASNHLVDVVGRAIDKRRLTLENRALRSAVAGRDRPEARLMGRAGVMVELRRQIRAVAETDADILIIGETGTGKEVAARALHAISGRRERPFIALNCAALPAHMIESELFGHVKGAFTDAINDRQGKFEYADGGTLFLDEVGDMPMPTQIKLLRVLEEREITRVGDNKPIPVNVRVLAATNKDLEKEIEEGRFRSDLYFRLKIVTVRLDPLSNRRDDILPLADYFRKSANKKNNKKVKSFSQDIRRWLLNFHWKGNVRQLKNVVESLIVMDVDGVLDMDDLSPDLLDEKSTDANNSAPAGNTSSSEESSLIGQSLKEIERWAIEKTLTLTGGNREETANMLGISERNLYRKLNEYQLR